MTRSYFECFDLYTTFFFHFWLKAYSALALSSGFFFNIHPISCLHSVEALVHALPYIIKISTFKGNWLLEYVLHDFVLVVPSEGRVASYHHEQYHSCRPNIALFSIVFAQNLRGDVIRRAQPCSQNLIRFFLNCNAKVYDFNYFWIKLKQHVLRFQIPMNDTLLM